MFVRQLREKTHVVSSLFEDIRRNAQYEIRTCFESSSAYIDSSEITPCVVVFRFVFSFTCVPEHT